MSAEEGNRNQNMLTARVCHEQPRPKKMTKHQAARKLTELVEASMNRKGLSEAKKNARVESFVEYVDATNADRAK